MAQPHEKGSPECWPGASEAQTAGHGLQVENSAIAADLQRRLSGFALALEAVLPDIAFLANVVERAAQGIAVSSSERHRLHKLALKIFDLREVLESKG